MKRIPTPLCVCCKVARAEWESERWPTILLCYTCTRELAQFIVERFQVVHGNPILLELVRGLDSAIRIGSYRFWIKTPSGSFSECWVNELAESRTALENPLDISGALWDDL